MYKISIEYCVPWSYIPRALSLEGALLKKHKDIISEIDLVPADGGKYEVSVNGDLIYSKLETGRHADPPEIIKLFENYIKE
jgi:selenoprotein W-related protein